MVEAGTHDRLAFEQFEQMGRFSSHLSFLWRQVMQPVRDLGMAARGTNATVAADSRSRKCVDEVVKVDEAISVDEVEVRTDYPT
jgi:hypothetical protein